MCLGRDECCCPDCAASQMARYSSLAPERIAEIRELPHPRDNAAECGYMTLLPMHEDGRRRGATPVSRRPLLAEGAS